MMQVLQAGSEALPPPFPPDAHRQQSTHTES